MMQNTGRTQMSGASRGLVYNNQTGTKLDRDRAQKKDTKQVGRGV